MHEVWYGLALAAGLALAWLLARRRTEREQGHLSEHYQPPVESHKAAR